MCDARAICELRLHTVTSITLQHRTNNEPQIISKMWVLELENGVFINPTELWKTMTSICTRETNKLDFQANVQYHYLAYVAKKRKV